MYIFSKIELYNEEKHQQPKLPQSVLMEIVYDVLGSSSQLRRLVDAEMSEFDSTLTSFQKKVGYELESPLKNHRDMPISSISSHP